MRGIRPVWIAVAVAVIVGAAAILYNTWAAKQANPGGVAGKPIYTLPPPPGKRTPDGRQALGNVEVSGPSIVQRDAKGNEVWSARTEGEVEVSDTDERLTATSVVWSLTRGEDSLTLKSGRMELVWSGGDVVFGGDIDIRDSHGRRFTATRARFESGTEKVICEGGVRWEVGRYSAAAEQLVIDVKHKRLRLRGGVKLTART